MAMPPAPLVAPGAMAAVRWTDGQYYFARVLQPLAGVSRIQFSDGAIETVPQNSIVPIPGQPMFRIGDFVLAVWKTDRMFPGTVTAIGASGFTVSWHDGDAPLVVPAGMLTSLARANAAVAPASRTTTSGWSDVTREVLGPPVGSVNRATPPPLTPGVAEADKADGFHSRKCDAGGSGNSFCRTPAECFASARLGDVVDEGTELAQVAGRPMMKGCWIGVDVSDVAKAIPVICAS